MISGISSGLDYNAIISGRSAVSKNPLSYEQQQVIDDTLSNYDSSNLSQSDALAIIAAFQDANIKPSKQLADAMSSLGFDAKEVGTLAGVSTDAQDVMDLFDKYNSNDSGYSQDEANTLVKNYLSEMLSDSKNYNHSLFYA